MIGEVFDDVSFDEFEQESIVSTTAAMHMYHS